MISTVTATYSSALTGHGALLAETITVLCQINAGHAIGQVREMVFEQDLLNKMSRRVRAEAWQGIHSRYLHAKEYARILARMVTHAPDYQTQKLVLFYELCRAVPIVRDTTLHCVYPRYAEGYSTMSPRDVQNYFDRIAAQHPELDEWSPQTRGKVVSNILAILRDFGLLQGVQRKQFTRLYVPLPAFVYCLYNLNEDGITDPYTLLEAADWRLFFLERADVLILLDEATAAGHCTFKHQGDIYSLDLAYPSLEVCVEALTAEV